jgi:copper chaperone CopZ
MRTHRIIPLFSLIVASLALLGCASGSKTPSNTSEQYEEKRITHQTTAADIAMTKSTEPLSTTVATLYVNGMGCPLCATNIDLQLERVKGVQTVNVDLGVGKVDLTLGGKERPSPARLARAVEDAGFTLVKIETR